MRKDSGIKLVRAPAVVLSYFGVLLLIVVTHLAGLWTYASVPQPAQNPSAGNPGEAPTSGGTNATEATAPKEPLRPSASAVMAEDSPTVTQSGYTIFPRCALWSAEGLDLYYSPADPQTICVQPPGSSVQSGPPPTIRTTQLPPNCAVGPDSAVYCLAGGQLAPDTLALFYNRGELQTPQMPRG